MLRTRALVIDTTLEGVEQLVGKNAREELQRKGLHRLHEVLPAESLDSLRAILTERLAPTLFQWAVDTSRALLEFKGEFYVDEKIYFRINYPYEVAARGPKTGEKKSLTARLRSTMKSGGLRGLGDAVNNSLRGKGFVPTLDLVRYNRNRPKATWAHGPHIDTWYGHAYGSINFWWSISGVNEANSMVIYPSAHKHAFPFEEENMYLKAGVRTPPPSPLSMKDGELALFDAELLHSTRLNTSDETRFVITVRVNESEPTFSAETTHAIYDLWHSSTDIERGNYVAKRRGRRISRKEFPRWNAAAPKEFRMGENYSARQRYTLGPIDAFERMNLVRFNNISVLVVRDGDTLRCVNAICPHVGRPLADGHIVDGQIQCPAHGVQFSLETGKSDCRLLALKTYRLEVNAGIVELVPGPLAQLAAEAPAL
jgi:nitrite reductase/ring-hydroxylating ferredoxin subunit